MHTSLANNSLEALKTLDAHLSTRTFFVGERITLADIVVATYIQRAATITIDAPLRAQLPNLIRHLETVINQPQFKDIFQPTQYIDRALQYVPPKKEKEKMKPPPVPPKPTKKATKPVEDEDEPSVPPQPKVHNPLDDLPKSSFNLEDWKRAYSNMDTRGPGGAIQWFYERYVDYGSILTRDLYVGCRRFDKEGFSVWRVDFKYNEELTQTYMSSNQIAGLFNRLEASRKYGFGSVGVLGVASDSRIAGVFIVRGQDIMPVVQVAPDWESYSFTKLDLANAEQKAFFEGALAWDLEIDGKKWVDGKAVCPVVFLFGL
jgi:elongation factor 1-gamma